MEVDSKAFGKEYKLDLSGSGYYPIACSRRHGNESSDSVRSDELLDHQTE
jgi:hypothetical protein